jgi:signal transduction histidine kinase
MQNLLTNAIMYTPAGGSVCLQISLDNKVKPTAYLISVADTGIGIPEAQKDKIFSKMFRANNAKDMTSDGTGLGLYIIKSILDNTGGTIWFEPNQSKGTVFYVKLPFEGMKQRKDNNSLP